MFSGQRVPRRGFVCGFTGAAAFCLPLFLALYGKGESRPILNFERVCLSATIIRFAAVLARVEAEGLELFALDALAEPAA
jgi:hypothetical protein